MKDPINFPLQFDKSEDSKELFGMELHGIIDTQVTLAVRLKFCKNYFNCGFQHMGRDRGLLISTYGFNEIRSVFPYFYCALFLDFEDRETVIFLLKNRNFNDLLTI